MTTLNSIIVWCSILFWVLAIGVCAAHASFLTFDCTPVVDIVTGAKIQFGTDTPVDVPLVSTCGEGGPTCTDPASKTICYPDSLWPKGSFVAKATVSNIRGTSEQSNPLSVPAVPTSPLFLKVVR